MSNPNISVEVISGGSGLRPSGWTILVHALAGVYFVVWSVLCGILLHWPSSMNAWVLAIVAAGTGFVVGAAVLAALSNFATRNIASNLEPRGLHYASGLVHVGIMTESTLTFFYAILASSALQLGFLALNETCCTWSGDDGPRFVATYLISLFLYHLGIAVSIKLLYTDLRPVFQVPDVFSDHKASD